MRLGERYRDGGVMYERVEACRRYCGGGVEVRDALKRKERFCRRLLFTYCWISRIRTRTILRYFTKKLAWYDKFPPRLMVLFHERNDDFIGY